MKLLGLVLVLWLAFASSALADTYTPTRFDDPLGVGNCQPGVSTDCSLRQAIDRAEGTDTIQLLEGTYTLTRGATLLVGKPLTIAGAGRNMTVIDGLNNRAALKANRILKITSGAVMLRDLTFKNGSDDADEYWDTGCSPCSTINFNGGGALYNDGGTVTVERVIFDSNRAPVGGAVATSSGTLSVTDSEFATNGGAFGAGLFTRGGTITVDQTTFRDGGGTRGGGLYVRGGQVLVTNSTVANNGSSSNVAGGVTNQAGTLTLRNVTLAGNVRGGLETDTTGSTTVQNSILGAGYSDGSNGSCVSPNQNSPAVDGLKTGQAITTDLGNNISEDSTCPLTGPNNHAFDNARLAPATFNGGVGYTAAPLFSSPAINNGNAGACSPRDQRGFLRDGVCDIGAMEALRSGSPLVADTFATNITASDARLTATVDLHGEAGQLFFKWGLNSTPQALINTTEPVGAFGTATAYVPFYGLDPDTTYYYRAYVDNATGEAFGDIKSFKTPAGPPQVNGIELLEVTDTTARIQFTVDPAGADTEYVVVGGNGETAPVHIAADAPSQSYTATLQGLSPNKDYTLRVLATNSGGSSSPDGATINLTTMRQVAGDSGAAVALDSEAFDYDCPSSATVDWGDTTDPQAFGFSAIHCVDAGGDLWRITLDAAHRYAAAGHYLITVSYDAGPTDRLYAKVAAPAVVPTPTATATPTETPTAPVVVAQVTPTPIVTPTPTPVFHQTVIVVPESGTVLVKLKGTSKFVPLAAGQSVPLGSQIDVTNGKIRLTSVPRAGGAVETADFYGGIFTVTQVGDVTVLRLSGPEPTCKKAKASAGKKIKKRSLWGDGKGKFRTEGKYSAATVRGTRWYVEDNCSGTLTKVAVGVVSVRDNGTKKTVTLRAGKQYLAKPKKK